MNRRDALRALLTISCSPFALEDTLANAGQADLQTPDQRRDQKRLSLNQTAPLRSRFDGQVFEFLDIHAKSGPALVITHRNVVVRHCRITHSEAPGLTAFGAPSLEMTDCEVVCIGVPEHGPASSPTAINIALDKSPGSSIRRVRAAHGSSNIYASRSPRLKVGLVELLDARGPEPRGQNIQFDKCPGSSLEDFSAENRSSSWTEDNISIFRSDNCVIRRGLVSYNNSPTGDGVMIEGSSDCSVEDVDAVQQGNGAFAAVPQGDARSGNCRFVKCRTKDSYNSNRDGREAPTSNGLSFYMIASPDAPPHQLVECRYARLANPANLVWKRDSLAPGWSLQHGDFEARPAIRLSFGW